MIIIKKLPDSELKIMLVLWNQQPPTQRNVISKELLNEGWSDPTILTMLSRLVKKGYLSCEKQGNKNLYTPLVSRENYMNIESKSIQARVQSLSATSLMASLIEAKSLTDKDIKEIEQMIQEYKNRKED